MNGAIAIVMFAVLAAVGALLTFWPDQVVRGWALASRRIYAGGQYDWFLERLEGSPLGKLQRRLDGMTTRELMDRAAEHPRVSPFFIRYLRVMGTIILGLVAFVTVFWVLSVTA